MIKIEMIPRKRVVKIYASQYDTGARKFEFELIHNGEAYPLTTETVTFVMPTGVEHDCTISNGRAVLDCYADMTAEAGVYRCKLRVTDTNGGVLNTAVVFMKVEVAA